MYERFTSRALKVMQLSSREAQRFNHWYVGTEHILLGLIKEGSGVAAHALTNLGVDLRQIRDAVELIVQARPATVTTSQLPETPRAKKVIEYAIEESRNLKHDYVGTEHLLLGLLREEDGVAAQILMNLNLKLQDVRAEVRSILGELTHSRDLPPLVTHQPSSAGKVSTNNGALPTQCPECGGTRIARIHSGYSLAGLLASDQAWRPWRAQIDGERELLGGSNPLSSDAAWACLDCRPAWLEVHRLAIVEEACERAKQENVVSRNFAEAARWRDGREAATAQIRALTAEWLA